MARQTINIGTSANKGDGDPLRTAFTKINNNFSELYGGNFAEPTALNTNLASSQDGVHDLGTSGKQWRNLHVKDFVYIGGTRLSVSATGTLLVNNAAITADAIKGSVFADDSSLLVDGINGKFYGHLTGDVNGSVFGDDSTILVDAVNGNIPGYVKLSVLKSEVAASTSFADFQLRIAAL
ncbi:MAG: hypothetical protein CMG35_04290 [Candidatus Marinimicrobia bacterium]|jgi:hypothetical protein|nr:hypothetical protein [Candidatus Neomarinimicrobiota bacterium]|tara:strand:+ start:13941 stop:14480 length:540 start_codon:yes stop_codon:yes gene_type:complete